MEIEINWKIYLRCLDFGFWQYLRLSSSLVLQVNTDIESACNRNSSLLNHTFTYMFILHPQFKIKLMMKIVVPGNEKNASEHIVILQTHTHRHTHYCVWLSECLLAAAEDWVASLLSHSTHQWKTIIKIGSSGSKLAVPWKSPRSVSNSDRPSLLGLTERQRGHERCQPCQVGEIRPRKGRSGAQSGAGEPNRNLSPSYLPRGVLL